MQWFLGNNRNNVLYARAIKLPTNIWVLREWHIRGMVWRQAAIDTINNRRIKSLFFKDKPPFQADWIGVVFSHNGKAKRSATKTEDSGDYGGARCAHYQPPQSIADLREPLWRQRDDDRLHHLLLRDESDSGPERSRSQTRDQGYFDSPNDGRGRNDSGSPGNSQDARIATCRSAKAVTQRPIGPVANKNDIRWMRTDVFKNFVSLPCFCMGACAKARL